MAKVVMRKKKLALLATMLFLVIILISSSFGFFSDRVNTRAAFSTGSFEKSGYAISRIANSGPYIAGETISLKLTEDNEKTEAVQSLLTMEVQWTSADTTYSPFDNSNSSDNIVVKVDGNIVPGKTADAIDNYYSYDQASGKLTIVLPVHKMAPASSGNERIIDFEIPDSLKSTGTFDFDFTGVKLSQTTGTGSSGFYVEYGHDELNSDVNKPMDFSADVVWDFSAAKDKSVFGKLSGGQDNYSLAITTTASSGIMRDWSSGSVSKQSAYKDSITSINLGDRITNIGDNAFAGFNKLTEITIPADVSELGNMAFGNCSKLTEITFNQSAGKEIIFPASGSGSGAFYVDNHSAANPLRTKVATNNQNVLDYAWESDFRGYKINVADVIGGVITVEPNISINGKTITLISAPDAAAGYDYDGASIVYTDESGSVQTITLDANTKTFIMPVGDVTITPKWAMAAPVAQAIYSADDKSLTFVYDKPYKDDGTDIFTDKTGKSKTVTAVYTGFENEVYASASAVPWTANRNNITSVVFEDEVIPNSTAYWFNYFMNCGSFDVANLNVSKVTNMSSMFSRAGNYAAVFEITGMSSWDTSNVENMGSLFYQSGGNASSWSIGDLSNWDTGNVENMNGMFALAGYKASSFEIIGLDNWNTSNVVNMTQMFGRAGESASNWSIGDLSKWKTSEVTNMSYMFSEAGKSSGTWSIGNISNWDTSNVTNMQCMFQSAGLNASYSLNLSGWDVSKVTSYYNFNYNVTSKVIAPSFGSVVSLSLLPEPELPEDSTIDESKPIVGEPEEENLGLSEEAEVVEETSEGSDELTDTSDDVVFSAPLETDSEPQPSEEYSETDTIELEEPKGESQTSEVLVEYSEDLIDDSGGSYEEIEAIDTVD